MRRLCLVALAAAALAWPALAASVANGVVLITQADALAGGVTPGDAAGFPITISVSGSYRLAGNITPSPGTDGFAVTAPEVTIDFGGFRMAGSGSANSAIIAIQRALTVKNGTIRGFRFDGIYASGPQLMVDGMRLADNGRYAINEIYVNASPKTGQEDGHMTLKNSILFRTSRE